MSYTIPSSVQTKAEAVLAVASAIADEDMGARYDGTVNTSLDVLADVLAEQDVDVPQTNAGAILALAQYASGGGSTVELTIFEVYGEQALTTAYFTAKNSAGESITPVLHEDGDESYFTIEVYAGSVVTLESVGGSGYSFNPSTTAYGLGKQGGEPVFAPTSASSSSITLVAVNDASYPDAYMVLMLSGTD